METKTVWRTGVFWVTLGAWGLTSLAYGGEYALVMEKKLINLTGLDKVVPTINGSVPGPTLRWREGEEVLIRVTNRLDEPTSLHWHGIILPARMDRLRGGPRLYISAILSPKCTRSRRD